MKRLILDNDLIVTPTYIPCNLSSEHQAKMFKDLPIEVKEYGKELLHTQGWKFFAVRQSRGYCHSGHKIITIPIFAIDRSVEYKAWYISHEMAHAYDNCVHNHGPEFMEWLKKICPKESIHFELGYKPRNAAKAGIKYEIDLF
jgi:predicted metal-dependent hydrolase